MSAVNEATVPPAAATPFLDVNWLLEASQPQARAPWFWYGAGAVGLLVVAALLSGDESAQLRQLIDVFSLLLLAGFMVASLLATRARVRRHRAAGAAVAAVEELLQLRRWEQAALLLERFLSQPTPSVFTRTQGLVYLSSLLGRYHRFEDALAVQNYILENELVDDASGYGLRMGRAMAMLREDHLVDADRAISDLRRRGSDEASGALSLIEIYRDVKTGHPAEAVDLFTERLAVMQRELGHRMADVHGLISRAYDLMGNTAAAAAAYRRATLLAPAMELHRRYPEVAALAGKYQPAGAPAEAM